MKATPSFAFVVGPTTRATTLAILVFASWSLSLPVAQAWIMPPRLHTTTMRLGSTSSSTSRTTTTTTSSNKDEQIDELKADIARMRQEALLRLESLNQEMHAADLSLHEQNKLQEQLLLETNTVRVEQNIIVSPPQEEAQETDQLYQARLEREDLHFLEPVTTTSTTQSTTTTEDSTSMSINSSTHSKSLRLLEDTRWRLMMNIGREPGTWMSKTWGASGERLRLHLELEFTKDQLYEREEFLNGFSGAQVLHIVNAEADLAPCLSHGGRKIRVKEVGGWRVAPKEGPLGTSVLRFYFDMEEEARHPGSDVYCPVGRIYCTCGYFSMEERHRQGVSSEKDLLKEEMRILEATYEELSTENELDTDLFSWKKLQRTKQFMDLRSQATKLNQKMHDAHVREPDRSILRLSRDQSVGLTKEGGVCCKVHKGLAIEYHILGKFEIASMENREHSDYRDLLMP